MQYLAIIIAQSIKQINRHLCHLPRHIRKVLSIYETIRHFLFRPFESRNYLKPNEGEGLQVAFFRVRERRAHTLTYVTEPKTRRKGARCALILRLDNKKARINRAFFVVVEWQKPDANFYTID